jgi:hypothetical protein
MQKDVMKMDPDYDMSTIEIREIVSSLERRNIRFDIIEITGGEPTLWSNIRYGVTMFKTVADKVTLVTNGCDPSLVMSLNLPFFGVSASQTTTEQLSKFEPVKDKFFTNDHQHKKPPIKPVPGSLPAKCTLIHTRAQEKQIMLGYMYRRIYYCCNACALGEIVGVDLATICDFEDDFLEKFKDRKFDRAICSVCLCNSKVWDKV